MKKTGKLNYRLLFLSFFGFLILPYFLNAQDVYVNATLSSTKIMEGELVILEIEVNNSTTSGVNRPQIPEIEGLRFLPNRTSQSTSISYVNGNMSVTTSYGYQFIAEKTGDYKVPPIEITVSGNYYSTDAIAFKILDNIALSPGSSDDRPDIYIKLEADNDNPVVGQQVIVSVILYFKQGIEVTSYQALPGWKAEGFWKEDLELRRQAQQSTTVINNVRYQKATLLNYAVFPTKSGILKLSPFSVSVRVRENRSFFDSSFGFSLGGENRELNSAPIELNVKELPKFAEDATSIGAVGNYTLKRSISKDKALVGESIEIITELTGSGNLPLVNKPNFEIPDGLEEYSPQENTDLKRSNNIISGTKTFTDILVPRRNGHFEIPGQKVAIYNPNKNNYDYFALPALKFEAALDPNSKNLPQITQNKLNITPHTGLAQWDKTEVTTIWNSKFYFALLPIPLVLLLAAFGYKRYYDKMNTDVVFSRARKALKTATETLKEAKGADNVKEGYHFIQMAITGFISDKLNLPEAGISTRNIAQHLDGKISKEELSQLVKLLDKCETITFAPVISQQDLDNDIFETERLITSLNKSI